MSLSRISGKMASIFAPPRYCRDTDAIPTWVLRGFKPYLFGMFFGLCMDISGDSLIAYSYEIDHN